MQALMPFGLGHFTPSPSTPENPPPRQPIEADLRQRQHTQATVLEQGTKRTWKIPCLSMHGCTDAQRQDEQTPYMPPPEPATATSKTREFRQGDTVTFEDRDGRGITGVVVRINQRTATIGTGTANGGAWRVPFHMLRHVLDI